MSEVVTDQLEFPKLPRFHKWSVRYDPTFKAPRLHVKIKLIGLFVCEEYSSWFDGEATPERLRLKAILIAKLVHANFERDRRRDRSLGALRAAAAEVERDLNSGDPRKVADK
ncbi:Uncharacterised protein [Mycobacteroides abscessus subsp. abscessus]|uniref:Uncharacterized protein n=1 Tax=Mycobacteroides abscessus subsp. massiliense TaxID=1962118 RepID=A0A1U0U3J9_9MYCO|nr:hypothetical protein [Mycobacteroides abscessus]MDM2320533.1 hypothetical protein [Mycobacteroides abscessus]MDM2322526.1 hypothetical protein [Mycobacteroides abscessus]MDM2326982.1 hypothetical protein [Mycobacteroides abscessus]MDM2331713.1 hypothetical protein [Mycobacteroides abscessus]MDM2337957.1 hypothetical protein [Mycobacteroides abscessus]